MIEDGLLQDPPVDGAIAMHCLTGSSWKTGTLLTAEGLLAKASADAFTVTVRGRGTHGATPEHGTDVIRSLTAIAQELLLIRSREVSAFTPAMLSVCQIHAGNADNALPDSGFLTGTFRTFDDDIQALFRRRIEEISRLTAQALGTEAAVEFRGSLASTKNDPQLCGKVSRWIRELNGAENCDCIGPVTGAEDFSEISRRIPSVYIDLSFGSAEEGYPEAVHSPRCLFNEEAMATGAACHAWCALRFLAAD